MLVMNRIKYFLITLIPVVVLFLPACIPPDISEDEDIQAFQKRADFIIETKDYLGTRKKLSDMADLYEGFIKRSSLHKDEMQNKTAEFEIRLPFKFFYDFVEDFREEFKDKILEEKIGDETALMRIYFSNNDLIKEKREKIEVLEEKTGFSDETDEKIVARTEIEKLENEIDKLTLKKLEMKERLNNSTINVAWREPVEFTAMPEAPDFGEEAIAGIEQVRDIIFTDYGQIETYELGEAIRVLFDSLDEDEVDLISKVDLDNGIVAMKTVRLDNKEVIYLETKCQLYNIGLGPIPEIMTSEELANEQIVITPRTNENCEIIGFEIRAGSVESGCRNGLRNLNKYKKCKKYKAYKYKKKKTVKKSGKEKKPLIKVDGMEWFRSMPVD